MQCEDDFYFLEGLGLTFQAILNREQEEVVEGIEQVVKEHRILTKKNGWFHNSIDEILSIYGIGLANLARHRGLNAPAIPPLIPEDLLVEVNET